MKPELHHFFSSLVVSEFRANGGRLGAPFAKAELVLLTTFSLGSGHRRTSPVRFLPWRDELVLVSTSPAVPWYQDILAWPRATVEHRHATYDVLATAVEGTGRERLLELACGSDSDVIGFEEATVDSVMVRLLRVDDGADIVHGSTHGDEFLLCRQRVRHQLAELRMAAAKLRDGGGSTRDDATVLHARCLRFCAALTELLSTEDTELYPALDKAVPGFSTTVPELRRHRSAVGVALTRFVRGHNTPPMGSAAWVADLASLAELFGQQVDCEATRVVPALNSPGYARPAGNIDGSAR